MQANNVEKIISNNNNNADCSRQQASSYKTLGSLSLFYNENHYDNHASEDPNVFNNENNNYPLLENIIKIFPGYFQEIAQHLDKQDCANLSVVSRTTEKAIKLSNTQFSIISQLNLEISLIKKLKKIRDDRLDGERYIHDRLAILEGALPVLATMHRNAFMSRLTAKQLILFTGDINLINKFFKSAINISLIDIQIAFMFAPCATIKFILDKDFIAKKGKLLDQQCLLFMATNKDIEAVKLIIDELTKQNNSAIDWFGLLESALKNANLSLCKFILTGEFIDFSKVYNSEAWVCLAAKSGDRALFKLFFERFNGQVTVLLLANAVAGANLEIIREVNSKLMKIMGHFFDFSLLSVVHGHGADSWVDSEVMIQFIENCADNEVFNYLRIRGMSFMPWHLSYAIRSGNQFMFDKLKEYFLKSKKTELVAYLENSQGLIDDAAASGSVKLMESLFDLEKICQLKKMKCDDLTLMNALESGSIPAIQFVIVRIENLEPQHRTIEHYQKSLALFREQLMLAEDDYIYEKIYQLLMDEVCIYSQPQVTPSWDYEEECYVNLDYHA